MKSIGFIKSHKENENRRAIIPEDIKRIKNKGLMYFEKGYGDCLGFTDDDYLNAGAKIATREEILKKDIICDPKIGDAEYLNVLHKQIIFGWVHAVQNKDITDKIIKKELTAYAWEDMYENGRHIFWKNNEIAGEVAISHAFQCIGDVPNNKKVALIGRGNVAMGAFRTLISLGAEVTMFNRSMEENLKNTLEEFDVIVNAVLWDTSRTDHLIYKEDLTRMKRNALIIDVSCDANGAIETSKPTSIQDPTYVIDGVTHYVVDHTPSLAYKYASREISKVVSLFLDDLIEEKENVVLRKALIIENGKIIDKRINEFQKR